MFATELGEAVVQEVAVNPPNGVICPNQNYNFSAELVRGIRFTSDLFYEPITVLVVGSLPISTVRRENGINCVITISKQSETSYIGNISLTLYSTDLISLNQSNLTCEALDEQMYVSSFTSYIFGKSLECFVNSFNCTG